MSWTEEKTNKLKKLWAEGHTASQIARLLGENISRNAVIGKAHRLNLAGRTQSRMISSPKINNNQYNAKKINRDLLNDGIWEVMRSENGFYVKRAKINSFNDYIYKKVKACTRAETFFNF